MRVGAAPDKTLVVVVQQQLRQWQQRLGPAVVLSPVVVVVVVVVAVAVAVAVVVVVVVVAEVEVRSCCHVVASKPWQIPDFEIVLCSSKASLLGLRADPGKKRHLSRFIGLCSDQCAPCCSGLQSI